MTAGDGADVLGADIFQPSKRQKVQLPWMAAVADRAQRSQTVPSAITITHVCDVYDMLRRLWAESGEETGVLDFESIYSAQTGDLVLSRNDLDTILWEMEEENVCISRDGNVHQM